MSQQALKPVPDVLISDLLQDDPDMFDLVDQFLTGLGNRAAELQKAHEQLDWDNLSTLAHQLKGAGGSYGYSEISELGKTMEQAFRVHSAEHFEDWMKQFEQLINAARAGLTAES